MFFNVHRDSEDFRVTLNPNGISDVTVTIGGIKYSVLADSEHMDALRTVFGSLDRATYSSLAELSARINTPADDGASPRTHAVATSTLGVESSAARPEEMQHAVETGIVRSVPLPGEPHGTVSIERRMAELNVPGAGIAVVQDGQVQWSKGYGELVGDVLIQAGSTSKTVTALAILSLVQQCREASKRGESSGLRADIDLDTDVRALLEPELLRSIDPTGLFEHHKMTIRQLLSHTAGLNRGNSDDPQSAEVDGETLRNTRVVCIPGTEHEYSNGGFMILQKIIEKVTGKRFEEVVKEHVFDRLDMPKSTHHPKDPPHVQGHVEYGAVVDGGWRFIPDLAAGGVWTTPADLANMVVGIQRAVSGEEGSIISRELAAEMLTPQLGGAGLGVFLDERPSSRYFAHDGRTRGFYCEYIADLAGQGAVVMTNSEYAAPFVREVLATIAETYGWPNAGTFSTCKLDPEELEAMNTRVDQEKWKQAVGTYRGGSPQTHTAVVSLEGDKLFVEVDSQVRLELAPLTESIASLQVPGRGSEVMRLQREDGKVMGINLLGADHIRVE